VTLTNVIGLITTLVVIHFFILKHRAERKREFCAENISREKNYEAHVANSTGNGLVHSQPESMYTYIYGTIAHCLTECFSE